MTDAEPVTMIQTQTIQNAAAPTRRPIRAASRPSFGGFWGSADTARRAGGVAVMGGRIKDGYKRCFATRTTEYPTAVLPPGFPYECFWSPRKTATSPGDSVNWSPDT